jgi:methylmalonyl-CoA mutase
MACVLGGASSLVCTPYDTIFKKSHAYSDRLSINQALIIKHECGLDKLIDPISGSYAVEKLSIEIAEKGLAYFKNIEAQGGLILALKNNIIQKNISLQFESQLAQYKSNEKELIGANILPDIETLSLEKFPFIRIEKRKTTIAPLISKRFSMDWEIEAQKSVYENK